MPCLQAGHLIITVHSGDVGHTTRASGEIGPKLCKIITLLAARADLFRV